MFAYMYTVSYDWLFAECKNPSTPSVQRHSCSGSLLFSVCPCWATDSQVPGTAFCLFSRQAVQLFCLHQPCVSYPWLYRVLLVLVLKTLSAFFCCCVFFFFFLNNGYPRRWLIFTYLKSFESTWAQLAGTSAEPLELFKTLWSDLLRSVIVTDWVIFCVFDKHTLTLG